MDSPLTLYEMQLRGAIQTGDHKCRYCGEWLSD
jgi:hypothetical protein